jgi:hypothetical protein
MDRTQYQNPDPPYPTQEYGVAHTRRKSISSPSRRSPSQPRPKRKRPTERPSIRTCRSTSNSTITPSRTSMRRRIPMIPSCRRGSDSARSGSGDCTGASQPSPPAWHVTSLTDAMWCRMVPLGILAIVLAVLFEVYKSDFERWVKPLSDWLRKRESWSWVIPVGILFLISFPPLFGHEIVLLVVGVSLWAMDCVCLLFANVP